MTLRGIQSTIHDNMPQIGHEGDPTYHRIATAKPWDDSTGLVEPTLLTYDDVTLVDQRTHVRSRREPDTSIQLSPRLKLNSHILSSNMDTVTEDEMAVTVAGEVGGMGLVHRNNTPERQAQIVSRVKRAHQTVVFGPPSVNASMSGREARRTMEDRYHGILFVFGEESEGVPLGIVTPRDLLKLEETPDAPLSTPGVITPWDSVHKGGLNMSTMEARRVMVQHGVEKLPLIDEAGNVVGVMALHDLKNAEKFKRAARDLKGRLIVGAAIGVRDQAFELERAQELIKAEVDALLIDVAHADSDGVYEMLEKLAALPGISNVDIIVGNVANPLSVENLAKAGVRIIKVGIGPGSACETRVVAGVGLPQWSAVLYAADMAARYGATIIADGGIRTPGDGVKAMGAGADAIMLGSMLAGTKQAPGEVIEGKNGARSMIYRGMSSKEARRDLDALLRLSDEEREAREKEIAAEGVPHEIPYKGDVSPILHNVVGGFRSAMSYANAKNVAEFQQNALFAKQTAAGAGEGTAHIRR